jgi:exodeoxyribonuclease III
VKIISWNVNGLRSCMNKGFMDFFNNSGADIFCIQETKLQQGDANLDFSGYNEYWNDADKKGYAGTAVFSRSEPVNITYGLGMEEDDEGRVITLEFADFYIVNVYVPNSGEELKRLEYRIQWDRLFRKYLIGLDVKKAVIACGDFNVAHKEIDIKNASSNRRHAGFTDEERESFSELLNSGYIDAFRELYPDARDKYTYWSYRFKARERNTGWRIDHAIISARLKERMREFTIYSDIYGSDHCPIGLDII